MREKIITKIFKNIEDNLLSIDRSDDKDNYYQLTIAIPPTWVFKTTKTIECSKLVDDEQGVVLRIKRTDDSVDISDLLEFTNIIIKTNLDIEEKNKLFEDEMEKYKEELVKKTSEFHDKMEKLKESSLDKIDDHVESKEAKDNKEPEPKKESESVEPKKESESVESKED